MSNKFNVSLRWTKGLSKVDSDRLTERLILNSDILKKIEGFIDDAIAKSRSEQLSKTSFEKPAWSEYQAYSLGEQKALESLKTLLQLRDRSDHD